MKLPALTKPCKDCPFRTDCLKGWLGKARAKEIAEADSFTCHKTQDPDRLQCAGHMLLLQESNAFYKLAELLKAPLPLSDREIVFETKQDFIKHHSRL